MKRRLFLYLILGGRLASTVKIASSSEVGIVSSVLRRRLPQSKFQQGAFGEFATAYIDRLSDTGEIRPYKFKLKILSLTKGFYKIGGFDSLDQMERFEEHIVTKFLLSTNYFSTASAPYKFIYLYDPGVTPCSNVFSRSA